MSKRIVVVDDDKEVQEIITFALTRNGFDVSVASHGQHLQQLLAAQTPDLIILDVMMPGVDGYQIFGSLRTNPSTRHIRSEEHTSELSHSQISYAVFCL